MAQTITKSAVKKQLDEHQVSADVYDALDSKVRGILDDAAERAEANGRVTVLPQDL